MDDPSDLAADDFRERIRLYQQNRSHFRREGLLPFVGKWVAFSTDGKQIVASHENLAGLESALQDMGADPQEVLFEQIREDENVVGADLT